MFLYEDIKKMALSKGAYDEWRLTPAPDLSADALDFGKLKAIVEGLQMLEAKRSELHTEKVVNFLEAAHTHLGNLLEELKGE